jgi:hypothetical protein
MVMTINLLDLLDRPASPAAQPAKATRMNPQRSVRYFVSVALTTTTTTSFGGSSGDRMR